MYFEIGGSLAIVQVLVYGSKTNTKNVRSTLDGLDRGFRRLSISSWLENKSERENAHANCVKNNANMCIILISVYFCAGERIKQIKYVLRII